jgi:hypothetical protein
LSLQMSMKYFILYLVACLIPIFMFRLASKKLIKNYFWLYVFVLMAPIEGVLIPFSKDKEPSKMVKYIVGKAFNW